MAEITYNIGDRTSADGLTDRARQILNGAAQGADIAGLSRITVTAGKGAGHKSHGSGTEIDIKGYNADGSLWSNAQRVAVAAASRTATADRIGIYQMSKGLGQGTLHLGYSGPGRPAAMWGANGLTGGAKSRQYTDPAEKAFYASYKDGRPFDYASLGFDGSGTAIGASSGLTPPGMVGFGARTLKQDREGEDVRQLQQTLAQAGFDPGPIDGDFGPLTKRALKEFQSANNLKADGVMGRNTAPVVQAAMAQQSESELADPGMAGSEMASPLAQALGVGAPVNQVTRAPLSPIAQATQVPDTVARQVPDSVRQPVGNQFDAMLAPMRAREAFTPNPEAPQLTQQDTIANLKQNQIGRSYRLQPPAPQLSPEQRATNELRQKLAGMNAMPRGAPQIASGATGRGPGSVAPTSPPRASQAASAINRSYPVGNSAVGAGGPPNPDFGHRAPPRTMNFADNAGPARPALQSSLNNAAAQKRTSIQNAIGNEMAGAYAPQKAQATTARPTYTPEMARQTAASRDAITARYAGLAANPAAAQAAVPPSYQVQNPATQNPVAAPTVPIPRPSPVPAPLTGAPGLIPQKEGFMNSPLGGALMGGLTGGPLGAALGAAKGAGVFGALGSYLKGQGGGIPNSKNITSTRQIPGGAMGSTQSLLRDARGNEVTVNTSNRTGVTSLASGGSARGNLKKKTRASRISGGLVV